VTDLVIFPDTDTLARKYALQGLAEHGVTGIKMQSKIPSPMPERFIRLFTLPGREVSRRTQWVQVIGYVYDAAGQDVRCSQLAQLLGAVLRSAPDMVVDGEQPISEPCEKSGPFSSQDPDLPGLPRYQVNLTWTVQSSVSS
jgi:hypothetical protein